MSEIQELIVEFDKCKTRELYVKIIEGLRTAEKLWAAYSPVTNNFYLDIFKGEKVAAFIFSDEEYYNVYEDRLKGKNIKIKPFVSSLEKRVEIFSNLYRSGFDIVVVDNGQRFVIIDLLDIIKKPDFSNVPEVNRPVLNPSLVAAANNFFQALSSRRPVQVLERRMFKEIYNARFLLPIDRNSLKVESNGSGNGEVVIKKDSVLNIPLITNENNRNYIAIFTDWDEFKKFDHELKFGGNIIKFEDLRFFCKNNDGLVINPFGFNMILNEETLKLIEDVATGKIPDLPLEQATSRDKASVSYREPEKYPKRMVEKIKQCLKKHSEVRSAYLKLLIKNDEESWIIVLDFDGDRKALFNDIAKEAIPEAGGKFISFAHINTGIGEQIAMISKPFYKA